MANQGHTPLTVMEDGGLEALMHQRSDGTNSSGSDWRDPAVLMAARDLLSATLPKELLDPFAPASERDPLILRIFRETIGFQIDNGGPLQRVPTDEDTLLDLFANTIGWGPAQRYLNDPRVQEVKINGDLILVQEIGHDFVVAPERFDQPRAVLDRALVLADALSVKLDRNNPQTTLPLGYGTRMHVTIPPCTPDERALVCIRRGRQSAWAIDNVLRCQSFDAAVAALLKQLCLAQCSFLIAGETGSGKTALLEALINSWPGTPHIITIEDNTLEVMVRHPVWTRLKVETIREPGAYGRAAKEALRQTPDVVAPGETRAEEAGAILSLATSGHAVLTTIHAQNAVQAIRRFAKCAAMPGAYMYEARPDDALEETCRAFDVVIHVEKFAGRRLIGEVVLLDGVSTAQGRTEPKAVPLVERVLTPGGTISWRCYASVVEGMLTWEGEDRTPQHVRSKLRRAIARTKVAISTTARNSVDDVLHRVQMALDQGYGDRALVALRRAWIDHRDPRLIVAAQQALSLDPDTASTIHAQSVAAVRRLMALIDERQWSHADAAYRDATAEVEIVAATTPDGGGWDALATTIRTGIARDHEARAVIELAQAAINREAEGEAAALLRAQSQQLDTLSPQVALDLLIVHEQALTILVGRGEVGTRTLEAVQARIAGLRARLSRSNSGRKRDLVESGS